MARRFGDDKIANMIERRTSGECWNSIAHDYRVTSQQARSAVSDAKLRGMEKFGNIRNVCTNKSMALRGVGNLGETMRRLCNNQRLRLKRNKK